MAGDDEVQVKFGASTGEAEAGVDRVGAKLKDLDAPVREVLESFGELRKTFVEAFAVKEIAEFVEHIAELGEEAIRTSQMLGISVEEVQKLGFAAKMVGGSNETMVSSLVRVERSMAEASDGTSKAAKAYAALGISQQQLKSSSPEQMLMLVADAFKNAKDGADKVAIANDIGGRSMAQQIPLLNLGSEAIRQMGITAENTGSILTDFQAEGLEKTAQSLTTLRASVEGVGISLFEVFKPAIDVVISGLTSLIQVVRSLIELVNVAAEAIEGGLLLALAAVIEKAEEMGVRVSSTFKTIKLGAEEVGAVLDNLAHGDLQGAVDAQVAGEQAITKANAEAQSQISALGKEYEELKAKIEAATEAAIKNTIGIAEGVKKDDGLKRLHAPTTGAETEDNTEEQIDLDKIKTEEELGKIGLQTQKDLLDQEVAAKQLSKSQEIAQLESFLGIEYQLESEALAKKLALEAEFNGQDSREYAQTLNEKTLLDAKYEQQLTRLAAEGAQAQANEAKKTGQEYKVVTDTIGKDFDSMLQGVLQGTETWQQAMGKLFSNIAVSAVEAIAKIAAEWLVFEVLTEGQGSWSDFMALEKPGGGGIASLLPSFDVGSWSVPQTGPAFIHAGEMIIPQQQAAAIRSGDGSVGSSGNSSNFVININAIDTQTGTQFLKNNANVIASALSTQARNFNSNLR